MLRDEGPDALETIDGQRVQDDPRIDVVPRRGAPDWFWPVIAFAVVIIAAASVLMVIRDSQLVHDNHILVCRTAPDRC